ncbi:hypothetical protein [Vibrio parahaemolyticus]
MNNNMYWEWAKQACESERQSDWHKATEQRVILDILVGNDWRHLHVTPKVARRYPMNNSRTSRLQTF